MYHVNNNMYYLESIAENIKAILSIENESAGTIP